MRRILVIGSGGAGKSTLARELGERLRLPVIHLDTYYWQAGWIETPKDEWSTRVSGLLAGDAWVMDGNYSGTFDIRMAAADTVIFLDLPRRVCLWRVIRRRVRFHRRARPDMHPANEEQLTWEFIQWIWTYPARRRQSVLERLRALGPGKRVVILRSSAEVKGFVTGVGQR